MNYKFPKSEKLRLKRDIEQLYKQGKTAYKYPVSVRYRAIEEIGSHLCGVSVPKKKFKKAVDRNRIKRQLREAYRLNKHLISSEEKHFHMMLVYTSVEKETYQTIEKAVIKLFKML